MCIVFALHYFLLKDVLDRQLLKLPPDPQPAMCLLEEMMMKQKVDFCTNMLMWEHISNTIELILKV